MLDQVIQITPQQ